MNELAERIIDAVPSIEKVRLVSSGTEATMSAIRLARGYTGRDLLTAHQGMNISEQEYVAVMDDILGALDKNGIDAGTRGDVTAILYSMKEQVIRV